jgi:hypothetical protein
MGHTGNLMIVVVVSPGTPPENIDALLDAART